MELNEKNYHSREADIEYMSVSQLKDFLPEYGGCEARAMAKLKGEIDSNIESTAMLQGSYVDAWMNGEEYFSNFLSENSKKIFTLKNELRAEFKTCNNVIDRIKKDDMFMFFLEGEKQKIFTAEINGMMWKCKTDSINHEHKRIIDLKIMKDMKNIWDSNIREWKSFIHTYGYDLQVSIYAIIVRNALNIDNYYEPFLAVGTKENPSDIEIIQFHNYKDMIRSKLTMIRTKSERIDLLKKEKELPIRCNECDYCIATKKLTDTKMYRGQW